MPTRRSFLGLAGAGALAAAGAGSTPLFASPARSSRPGALPTSDKWDMTWVDRLKGKHKAVFDSPEVSDGAALFRAMVWADQLKEVYGTPRSDVSSVVVVRHMAMPLVMNDEFWKRFNIGKQVKMKDPATHRWYAKNPVMTTPPDTPPAFANYNVPSFQADGGIILACGMAFQGAVARFAAADKLSHEDADKRAREHLLPGVILQPSGIFAVLTAQEAGCNYALGS